MKKQKGRKNWTGTLIVLTVAVPAFTFIIWTMIAGANGTLSSEETYIGDIIQTSFFIGLGLAVLTIVYYVVRTTKINKARRQEFLKRTGCVKMGEMPHICGLPVIKGAMCQVGINNQEFVFQKEDKLITLPLNRVIDVGVKNKEEIRSYYVSNAGTAIAGGMMFGEIGALLGGQPEKVTETIRSQFFIIIYHDGNSVSTLMFDALQCHNAWEIDDYYKNLPKAEMRFTL